ncbi:hypothetical protein DH2020_020533 [Rehmannia glutinosa]|uniref:UBN2 domain-containing protein n=1 Tax=Rehmannia glutinosa TaxID=99300 RepID=A0ABR0WHW1_REHGL
MVEKPIAEWTNDDKKRYNLDNVAKDILYKTLDKSMFNKVKYCKTTKEIWDKLTLICEGSEQIKENKLSVVVQKFENFKMLAGETLDQLDARFTKITNELSALGKKYTQKEMCMKILRSLPAEWEMKVMAPRHSMDLSKTSNHELFSDLKAYEFE